MWIVSFGYNILGSSIRKSNIGDNVIGKAGYWIVALLPTTTLDFLCAVGDLSSTINLHHQNFADKV